MAIAGKPRDKQIEDESSGIKSPGMQWLHYLGVADSRGAVDESQLTPPPSAKAWLSRKSRQIFGLPPRPQQTLAHADVPLDRRKANASTGSDGNSADGVNELDLREANDPAKPHTQSPGKMQDIKKRIEEDPEQPVNAEMGDSDGLQMPQTVFLDAKPALPLDDKSQRDRQGLQFKPQLSLRENARKGFQQSKGKPFSLSLPPSHHASEQDGSSNEDRALVRRGAVNTRPELQDYGSVSLAYSEHDQSSDTEVTDGSTEPTLAKGKSSKRIASLPRHDSQGTNVASRETKAQLYSEQKTHNAHSKQPIDGKQEEKSDCANEDSGDHEAVKGAAESVSGRMEMDSEDSDVKAMPEAVKQGPVFVPIVMEMASEDQAMLVEQRQPQLDVGFLKLVLTQRI